MNIETVQDWNERLEMCGCCPMPECPRPLVVTSRKTGASDFIYFFYYPFVAPDLPPEDFFPTIYRNKENERVRTVNGTVKLLNSYVNFPGSSGEIYDEMNYVNWTEYVFAGELDIGASNGYHVWREEASFIEPPICEEIESYAYGEDDFFFPPADVTPNATPDPIVEPATLTYWFSSESALVTGDATPQGCPGPFEDKTENEIDLTIELKSVTELSDPVTPADVSTQATDEMNGVETEWSDPSVNDHTDFLRAEYILQWPRIGDYDYPPDVEDLGSLQGGNPEAFKAKVRFRFRIPITHTGTKFFFTYDIADFPDDGDPSFASQDNVIEWTGPGTGDQSDPSWLTDEIEITPLAVPGERRVVNIRYTCYSGTKYGVKPQVMGEVLDMPPP